MIRFLLTATFVILYLILGCIPALVLWLIGKKHPEVKDRVSVAMVRWAFRVCLWISHVQLTIEGQENLPGNGKLPADQAVLYVGNHRSFFDILIGYTNTRGRVGFVAKKEMEKIPLLSLWMRYLYCLFLDRVNIKEGLKTILTGIEYVKKGISIWIFPEGTRNKDKNGEGTLLEFHEGSLKIAEKGKCPIIPVAMIHTADIFENHLPKIKPQKVTVRFGSPIYLNELPKEERKFSGAYTQQTIQQMLNDMLGRPDSPSPKQAAH